jgi:thiamine biosynthesis protein ThiS
VQATVNGSSRDLPEAMSLADLLAALGINLDGIAIAVNDAVVPRNAYKGHRLRDGDRIEIIKAVSGG